MEGCPELGTLESEPLPTAVRTHVDACVSCKLVVEILERANGVLDVGDCLKFDALLAARSDGTLTTAGNNLLDRHLASCEACRLVAETLSPSADRGGDLDALPSVDPAGYALGLEVARGGMGRILAARDLRVGRPVAVKELLGRSPQLAARFEREARVTARLQHPGIVPIYEIGKWPDGTPFYTMRMVDGRTLREAIEATRTLADRIALIPALIAAAEAVAFAHAQRVIHRDLTPSNIFVGAYGETVVLDWGLAKDLSEDEIEGAVDDDPYRSSGHSLTGVGAVIGTVMYMPPEQAHAQPVDERADVYALGAILYHVLSGAAPYQGRTAAEQLRAVKTGPPRAIDEVVPGAPRDLVSIVTKAMARDPELRYPTARELTEELRRFQTGRMVEAHEYSTFERVVRFVRRYRAAVTVTALALVLLVVGSAIAVTRILRSNAQARATVAELLQERGRVELLGGNPTGALAYLHAAAGSETPNAELLFLFDTARRSVQRSTLLDCTSAVRQIEFSPDGTLVAAACSDVGRIWRMTDGYPEVARLGSFSTGFHGLLFTPDGKTLATWGDDGIARVWDARTGTLVRSFAHGAALTFATFTPDAARLATTGADGFARIWNVASGEQMLQIDAAESSLLRRVYGLLSTDGNDMLTVTIQGVGRGWDARTGALRGSFEHGSFILGGKLSRDGRLAISCGIDRLAKIWDAHTGSHLVSLAGHTDVVWKCLFDATGKRALTAGHDGRANVWDTSTGALITAVDHGENLWTTHFAPDGRRFVTVSFDGSVKVWDTTSGAPLASHDSLSGQDAVFAPDSRRLFVQRGDGRIEIWSDSASQALAFRAPDGELVRAVNDDGTRALTGFGSTTAIWNTETAQQVVHETITGAFSLAREANAVVGWSAGALVVIDLASGKTLHRHPLVERPREIHASARGEQIATISSSGAIELWNQHGDRSLLEGTHVRLADAAMRAVTWRDGGRPLVWDLDRRTRVELALPSGAQPIGFSRDGRRLVVRQLLPISAYSIWDADRGTQIFPPPLERTLIGDPVAESHTSTDPTIDPSGRWLTALGADGRVTIRSLDDGRERASFFADDVMHAQVDARGELVAAIGESGTTALVLGATDGRLLARWEIDHPAPTIKESSFRAPEGTATWARDGTKLVTMSRSVEVWHTATNDGETFAQVMKRVPLRVVDGKLTPTHDGFLLGRVVRGSEPVANARVSLEIRITPQLGGAEIDWQAVKTRYTRRSDIVIGPTGEFSVAGLTPGTYSLSVTDERTVTCTFDAFAFAQTETVVDFDLASPRCASR